MKKFNTLYGGPPIIRDDSSPNGFTTTDPGEEKLFESILDKYKKIGRAPCRERGGGPV